MKKLYFIMALMFGCAAQLETGENLGSPPEPEEILEPVGIIADDDCQHIQIGDKACNFRLIDQNGDVWDLYSHKGKVIVLDLSAMWCQYCVTIAPKAAEYKVLYGEENFIWLTLLVQDFEGNKPDITDLKQWELMSGVNEPILAAGDMKDLSGEEGYPITGYPTIVLITDRIDLDDQLSDQFTNAKKIHR